MMNYEMFKEITAEQILSYMPQEFKDYTVEINPVNKVNKILDGMNLLPPDNENFAMSPIIYLNHMYEHYLHEKDLQIVLETAAGNLMEMYQKTPPGFADIDWEAARDKVIMTLINTEQNKEMLKDIPHREFQDLSIVYRYVVEVAKDGVQSAQISNHTAESLLGMNEQELYEAAVQNTRELFPPVMKNMNDLVSEIFNGEDMPPELLSMFVSDVPDDKAMFVLTNNIGVNGAVSMLYEDELHKLAEELGTDLYIMPSSIHETIAVSVNAGDPNELAEMVKDINMDQVSLEERLSNQIYHYDKDLRTLTLATDTPCKSLDGMVAEERLPYENKQSR